MDERTRENWVKVKVALEEKGRTDAYFYRLALKRLGLPGGENVKEIESF